MKLSHLSVVLALATCQLPALAIEGGVPTNNFLAVGMGVQVAPDWVMTVRHAAIAVGDTYSNGYGARIVAEIYTPNQATFPADDFALLRLVPNGSTGVYPTVGSQLILPGTIRPLDVTIVSPNNHSPRGAGYTRVQEAVPEYDDDGPGPLPAVPVNWLVSYDTSVYVQGGDSGGGLFLSHARDSTVLLGLASAQLTDENKAPIGSAFVQPAAYRSWIESVMSSNLLDDQMVSWASSPVPEPATWLMWAAGVALLVTRRRP
jgi:hypothetical protein